MRRRGARRTTIALLVTLVGAVLGSSSAHVSASTWSTTFHALTPARLLDTRPGAETIDGEFSGTGKTTSIRLQVAGRGGVPADDVGAVVVNVTAAEGSSRGFLSATPDGPVDPSRPPSASTLNWAAGQTVANMAIVPLSTFGTMRLDTNSAVQVIVDVLGWYPTSADAHALQPARLLDTRPGNPTFDGRFSGTGSIGPGRVVDLPVTGRGGVPKIGVGAVAVNLTVDSATASSYLTTFPTGAERPNSSSLNFRSGQTVANMVIVPVGADGRISIANYAGDAPVIVDVLAWFPLTGRLTALTPARLMDTRPGAPTIDGRDSGGGPRGPGSRIDLAVLGRGGVPATGVSAVVVNITVTDPTSPSFVTAFPSGAARPNSSNVNFLAGETVANAAIVPLGSDGRISLFNYGGTTELVVDVLAWVPGVGSAPSTERIDVSSAGVPANATSALASMSADGRLVVFASPAGNLVPGDDDGRWDVFLRDTSAGTTTLLSDNPAIVADALDPTLSADGSTVVYEVAGQGPRSPVLVVEDVANHATTFVGNTFDSLPSLSGDGRYLAFASYDWYGSGPPPALRTGQVWLADTWTGATRLISARPDGTPGNGRSGYPIITADGNAIVYQTESTNLVASSDVTELVRTTLADLATVAIPDPTVTICAHTMPIGYLGTFATSRDGQTVAFVSEGADGTQQTCVRDLRSGSTTPISTKRSGTTAWSGTGPQGPKVGISGSGAVVAIIGYDGYTHDEVWVSDRRDGSLVAIDVASTSVGVGAALPPSVSDDGRFVSFGVDHAQTPTATVPGKIFRTDLDPSLG